MKVKKRFLNHLADLSEEDFVEFINNLQEVREERKQESLSKIPDKARCELSRKQSKVDSVVLTYPFKLKGKIKFTFSLINDHYVLDTTSADFRDTDASQTGFGSFLKKLILDFLNEANADDLCHVEPFSQDLDKHLEKFDDFYAQLAAFASRHKVSRQDLLAFLQETGCGCGSC